jgi:chromosome segregation ATPase
VHSCECSESIEGDFPTESNKDGWLKISEPLQATQDELRRENEAMRDTLAQMQEELKTCQKREERMSQEMQSLHHTLQVWNSLFHSSSSIHCHKLMDEVDV